MTRQTGRRLSAALLVGTCLSTSAWATDFNVGDEAQLRSALNPASGAQAGDRIIFTATIALTADLPAVQRSVTIVGNNNTLSGNNQFRGLFVGAFSGSTQVPVTVAIQDLVITDTRAQGGAGGASATEAGAGGGGAGLGGALFVASAAVVTVSNVTLSGNNAVGGTGGSGGTGAGNSGGGGGGLGGAGGNGGASSTASTIGGGGGVGVGATGRTSGGPAPGSGILTGASRGGGLSGQHNSGGADGGGGTVGQGGGPVGVDRDPTDKTGGNGAFGGGGGGGGGKVGGGGGFGGGGGGSGFAGVGGGSGGFGGGGGGGGGSSGFGGGAGGSSGSGGGGLGAGGAVFVQQGGSITLAGPLTVDGNAVTAGTGGSGGGNGSASGAGLFLQGNGTVTFAPGAGQTQTVADAIADQTGSGGTGTDAGSYSLVKTDAGTTILAGANTYSGGTTISGGTLSISSNANLGAAAGTLTFDGGALRTTGTFTMSRDTTFNASGGAFATAAGTTLTHNGSINGASLLNKLGAGTLVLGGNNNYVSTIITEGTLSVSANANLGDAIGSLAFLGGTLQTTGSFAMSRSTTLVADGTFDTAAGTTLTQNGNIDGAGGLTKSGAGTLVLTGANSYGGGTTIDAGTIAVGHGQALGTGTAVLDGGNLRGVANVTLGNDITFAAGTGVISAAAGTTLTLAPNALSFSLVPNTVMTFGSATDTGTVVYQAGTSFITNIAFTTVVAGGTLRAGNATFGSLTGNQSSTTIVNAGATLDLNDFSTLITNLQGIGSVVTGSSDASVLSIGSGNFGGAITGAGRLDKIGTGTLILTGNNTYAGGTTVSGGTLQGNTTSLRGNILNNSTVAFDQGTDGTYAGSMSGMGSLTKLGAGTLTLTGTNTHSGGTTVSGGLISFAAAGNLGTGAITLAGGGLQWAAGNTADISARLAPLGAGGGVFDTNGNNVTLASAITGAGGLTKQGGGTLTLAGVNSYTGATTVNGGTLAVNGSLASSVTLGASGTLGGNGTIGGLVSNGGTLAPGNSIGTLNVNGNFAQNGGTYQVEANAAGQSDRINATGAATINGGTVQVQAASGSYGNSTTYTILNATGGVTGAYSSVASNFAFLTPSLSYDANNVFLTLALQGNAFSGFGGNTPNQRAVGSALDRSYANALGDFATVIGALAGLNTQQGPWALSQISGQPYADFGSFNVANNALFMNALGQQMALARGGSGSGQRQALAQACDVAACEGLSPFSVWGSGLGGVGSVQGNGNSNTFTYNVGGTAAGIDYRVTPNVLVGLGAGYTNGTQWADSFQGKGWSNTVSVAAYGSFTQWGLYVDALAGYAYSNNQLQRQISIPGLQPRTANGSTGANQFLGQVETGYRVAVHAPAKATLTPFARFQASSINQAAFGEWGANSLSLNVAQQTTTSVRTTLGADLAGEIELDDTRSLELGLRLGWLHEYADTARPMTAAFAGAPSASFTVYGATPQRDAAVIGFSASTTVAAATQLYLRYDGEVGSGTDNHALNIGVRVSW